MLMMLIPVRFDQMCPNLLFKGLEIYIIHKSTCLFLWKLSVISIINIKWYNAIQYSELIQTTVSVYYAVLWLVFTCYPYPWSLVEITLCSRHYDMWRLPLCALLLCSMTHYDITMGHDIANDVPLWHHSW